MAEPISAGVALGLTALASAQEASAASATRKVARAQTRLDLARTERGGQQQLAETLARQNVRGGAQGISTSGGSLMRQAMAARRAVRRGNGLARGAAALQNTAADQRQQSEVTRSLIDFGRAGLQFGRTL